MYQYISSAYTYSGYDDLGSHILTGGMTGEMATFGNDDLGSHVLISSFCKTHSILNTMYVNLFWSSMKYVCFNMKLNILTWNVHMLTWNMHIVTWICIFKHLHTCPKPCTTRVLELGEIEQSGNWSQSWSPHWFSIDISSAVFSAWVPTAGEP